MRSLPFPADSFDGAIAVQSIEHVPDPERAVAEIVRVMKPGGIAVLVTPNRLTFARPDEIIDPYHFVEFAPEELRTLCRGSFEDVQLAGIFGSDRYGKLVAAEHEMLEALLRRDLLRLRRLAPRRVRQRLYDWRLRRARAAEDPAAAAITTEDFTLGHNRLDGCLDIVAICR
jgi:SAM-dependent methyltransferase